MQNIEILTIGRVKNKYIGMLVDEYLVRLRPFARVKVVNLVAEKFNKSSKVQARVVESDRMEKYLKKQSDACIYLLDEGGQEYDSDRFSKKVIDTHKKIIFVIAGSLGFSDELKGKYPRLSLSRLTFLHEFAYLLLLEQIYRGVSILRGKEYHY